MLNDLTETDTYLNLLLNEIYSYDPKTGLFTYKTNRGHMKKGEIAGAVNNDGYIQIRLGGKLYYAHRLAFLWVNGKFPEGFVDHKDTNRSNNKWDNLRIVNQTTNNRNKSPMKNNTSGHVGVSWDSSRYKWEASICVDGRKKFLGRFDSYEDAITARLAAEIKYGYAVDKVWDSL